MLSGLRDAIDALPYSKAIAPHGLPSEFCKRFKDLLCPFHLSLFNEAHSLKSMSPTFSKIHAIFQSTDPGKLRKVYGYCPIALCNVDYNIFAKVSARRLQSVKSTVVGNHQTCSIEGRSIVTNINTARSVLQSCTDNINQVALVNVDLAKALDKVNHCFFFLTPPIH